MPDPIITSVTPDHGPAGTFVTLDGFNFLPTGFIFIAGIVLLDSNVLDDNTVTGTLTDPLGNGNPDEAATFGPNDVTFERDDRAFATLVDGFSISGPHSVSPDHATFDGGTTIVTITGYGFVMGCTVQFDGVEATDVIIVNDTTITCQPPAHAPGAIRITVTFP